MADNKYRNRNKEDLLQIARERDLAGRSSMDKDELADALEKDDQERGVEETAADKVEGGKNEEGGRGVAQEEGADVASRLHDNEPSEEAVKEYQEEYAPKQREERAKAVEEGEDVADVGYQSEASDPENPLVEEKLEDKEAYDDFDDHDKELADLALDASGPLNVQSPYGRVMTGAVDEEQAKEQEQVRGKLHDDFVGNLTEHVSDEDAERINAAFEERDEDAYAPNNNEEEPPLVEQFKARQEHYGRLLKRSNDNRQSSADVEEQTIRETQGEEKDRVGRGRVWAQRAVLDTTGLGGPGSDRIDKAYRTADVSAGQSQATFHAEDPNPREQEVLDAEEERQEASDYE